MTHRKHPVHFWKVLFLSCLGAVVLGVIVAIALYAINPPEKEPDDTTPPVDDVVAPFYITTMTHMEGNFRDDVDRDLFLRHVDQMRWGMDLFDEYGAKLTFESESSFAEANVNWDLNILKEVVDNGHGVGTHADFGATQELPVQRLVFMMKENKALIDDLVGAEHNRGISGGTGPTDWVIAASRAGFDYMDAVTGFGYLSMDERERPDGWTDTYIKETAYHDSIPPEFEKRIYPMDLRNAEDLEPDTDGVLTIMNGDMGELASLAEGRTDCFPDCTFDQDDIDEVIGTIKEADRIRDEGEFTHLNMHIPMDLLKEENEELLRTMLAAIQEYVNDGTLHWGTQLEAYEAYQESK